MTSTEKLKVMQSYGKVETHQSGGMYYVYLYLTPTTHNKLYWMGDSILSEDAAICNIYDEITECMLICVGLDK